MVRAQIRKLKSRSKKEPAFEFDKEEEIGVGNLQKLLDNVSLKNVPLEERRREAQKPLYLFRYE